LGIGLIGHLLGNYGRSVALTYSLEVTVFPYEAYDFYSKCCISLFKNKLSMFIEFARTHVYKMFLFEFNNTSQNEMDEEL
jgi:hypothetical protein